MFPILLLLFCVASGSNAAPLVRRMVDLTYAFNEHADKYPIFKPFNLTVVHNETFGDTGIWVQFEEYVSSTHVGTHMDAPSHFIRGGMNIDQIPISNFIAPAAVIDITEKAKLDRDVGVTVEDLVNWEEYTGQSLNGAIVLMRSGYGRKYHNHTDYIGTTTDDTTQMHFPGLEPEAAQWLVDSRNIVGFGVDTMSFDKGNSVDFMSHSILLGNDIFGLENMANLENIPLYGATLYVMPMKMSRASGAPTRIIATYPEVIFTPR